MKNLSRVVWSEGMYLGPHHFQVQNRYFEDSIRFATESLWYAAYGVVGYELDAEALRNGTVSLIHARGVFPDGLPFHMPESDPLPPTRAIGDLFPPTRDSLTILLAIPGRKVDGLNCVPAEEANGTIVRYLAENRPLHDETTGRDDKPVQLGRKNIQLKLDTEPTEGMVTLPIGRVKRDGTGHYIYDPLFIPPCLQISASDSIMRILQRLIEILDEKAASLERGKQGKKIIDYSTREIASFWLLHTVNSALVPLRHHFVSKRGHPDELYTEMARLGGALCTFALESHPRAMPKYHHDRLDETFHALDEHIRTHLELIVPTNCISVPLHKVADYFYEGEITDQRCLINKSRWVFAISSPVGEVQLISTTPKLVKICSVSFVPELVKRALPGMNLTHLQIPPSAISVQFDTQYFGVDRSGPCWDHLSKTRKVGVFVPGEITDPTLELLVVLET